MIGILYKAHHVEHQNNSVAVRVVAGYEDQLTVNDANFPSLSLAVSQLIQTYVDCLELLPKPCST